MRRRGQTKTETITAESGALTTLTALMVSVMFLAFLALTVDVGRTVLERRELQNGADAGALSLAQSCAEGNCSPNADELLALVDANARDGEHAAFPCGSAGTGLPPCPASSLSDLTLCPPLPAGVSSEVKYAEVHTQTSRDGGSAGFLENIFAPLAGGSATSEVRSCARAGWGPPGSASVLPITFHYCEYAAAIRDVGFGSSPIDVDSPNQGETALTLKYHAQADHPCEDIMQSGMDAPGGFGWLFKSECLSRVDDDGWIGGQTGRPSKGECFGVGDVYLVPIHDQTNDRGGSNNEYRIDGFAAFYISAIQGIVGMPDATLGSGYPGEAALRECSEEVSNKSDGRNPKCIFGWFIDDYIDFTGTIDPEGTDYGVTVVQPLG